jgi:Gas vesicle synthesis protein GvpL/GvpF
MSLLYLYALVGERPRAEIGRGLRRERLELVPGRGFHVVVGRMAAPPAAAPDAFRRHDATVRRIAATVDAILPIRFGSTAADEWAAARLLAPRALELAGRLVHVRGHQQMTLRVFGPRRAPKGRPMVRAAAAALGPGAHYLARRKRVHDAAGAPELDPIRPLLLGLVADERVQRHATPPLVASVYHLVPRALGARYRTRVTRAAGQLAPLRVTISGPWPPYAFGADVWP